MRFIATCSSVYGVFFLLVVWYGCQQANPWQAEAEALMQQSAELEAHHDLLNARIDSLWDATSAVIEKDLPVDFPSVDRDIFLHSRNADHIRMFMSFNTLSQDVQATVNAAAMYDAKLASEVKELHLRHAQFDKQKNQFLMKVAGRDRQASKSYAEKFVSISTPIN